MLLTLIFKFVMIVPFDSNLCCLEGEMEGGLEIILRDINSMKKQKGGSCMVGKDRESKNREVAAGTGAPCRNLFIF